MYVKSFKQLIVWQRAIEVVEEIYSVTKKLPDDERNGLTSQRRRAAVSVPANIAKERNERQRKIFYNVLRIVDGSAAELETLLIIATDAYPKIELSQTSSLLEEVQKMLTTLIKKLDGSPVATKS